MIIFAILYIAYIAIGAAIALAIQTIMDRRDDNLDGEGR